MAVDNEEYELAGLYRDAGNAVDNDSPEDWLKCVNKITASMLKHDLSHIKRIR